MAGNSHDAASHRMAIKLNQISLPQYVDNDRDMDANRYQRPGQVHQEAAATGLLDTGDTVS
ncbi:MAG TPA: hypothetical protein VGZ28_05220, partial [Terriglobales bacterium]|nr:hypothetical protein [Terriglobales bacterium]